MVRTWLAIAIAIAMAIAIAITAGTAWASTGAMLPVASIPPRLPTACDTLAVAALCDGQGPAVPFAATGADGEPASTAPRLAEVDLPALPGVLGLELVRHYDGGRAARPGSEDVFGRGWRLSYEARWRRAEAGRIVVDLPDGRALDFVRPAGGAGPWREVHGRGGTVEPSRSARGEELLWIWPNGRRLHFAAQGHLVQIVAPGGEFVSLQHDVAGRLLSVTDPQGRTLRLRYLETAEAVPVLGYMGVRHVDTPVGRFSYEYAPLPDGVPPPRVPSLAKADWPTHVELDRRPHAHANRPSSFSAEARVYHHEAPGSPWQLTGVSHQSQREGDQWASTPVVSWPAAAASAPRPVEAGGGTEARHDAQGRLAGLRWPAGFALRIDHEGASLRPASAVLTGPDGLTRARWNWTYNEAGQLLRWQRQVGGRETLATWRHEAVQGRSLPVQWSHVESRSGRPIAALRVAYDARGDQVMAVEAMAQASVSSWEFELDAAGRWAAIRSGGAGAVSPPWPPRAAAPWPRQVPEPDEVQAWTRLAADALDELGQALGAVLARGEAAGDEADPARSSWRPLDGGRVTVRASAEGGLRRWQRDAWGRVVWAEETGAAGGPALVHRLAWAPDGSLRAQARRGQAVGQAFDAGRRLWHRVQLTLPEGAPAGSAPLRHDAAVRLDAAGRPVRVWLPDGLGVAVHADEAGAGGIRLLHPDGSQEPLDLSRARRWACPVPCGSLPLVVLDVAGRVAAHHVPVAADQWVRIEVSHDPDAADAGQWLPVRREPARWRVLWSALVSRWRASPTEGDPLARFMGRSPAPRAWRVVNGPAMPAVSGN